MIEVGTQLETCRGQGYDGASAISSKSKGVSGRILPKNPKTLYVHCSSHRLNPVVATACKLPAVRKISGPISDAMTLTMEIFLVGSVCQNQRNGKKKGNSGKEGMLSRESNGKRGVKRKNESGQK